MGVTCRKIFRVFDSILLLIAVIIQGTALNFFLIDSEKENKNLYFWFIGDGIVLLVFIVSLIISYRVILVRVHEKLANIDIPHIEVPMYGTLPFGYISWLIYGSLLVTKIVYIFKSDIPKNLPTKWDVNRDINSNTLGTFTNSTILCADFYTTTSLKVILSLTTIIFILLINTENDAEPNTERNNYIGDLCKGIAFDIFDSIYFLNLLFLKESHLNIDEYNDLFNNNLKYSIIGLSCINFLLPALSLMKLSLSDFGQQPLPIRLSLLVKTLKLFAINLPYMVIRIYVFKTDSGVSLFLVKNVLSVAVSLRYMIPEYVAACEKKKTSTTSVKPINVMPS